MVDDGVSVAGAEEKKGKNMEGSEIKMCILYLS